MLEYLIPDEKERVQVLGWLAFIIQHPEIKINWQILMIGIPGNGKDSLFSPLASILGSGYGEAGNRELKGEWGDYKFGKKLVVYQEIYNPDKHEVENNVKTDMATTAGGTLNLNLKGKGLVEVENKIQFILVSNFNDAMHISAGDRRYFCIQTPQKNKMDNKSEEWFIKYYQWFDSGGSASLMHYLLDHDTSNFQHWKLPFSTKSHQMFIEQSKPAWQLAIKEKIEADDEPFHKDYVTVSDVIEISNKRYANNKSVPKLLIELGYKKVMCKKKVKIDGKEKWPTEKVYVLESCKLKPAELFDLVRKLK